MTVLVVSILIYLVIIGLVDQRGRLRPLWRRRSRSPEEPAAVSERPPAAERRRRWIGVREDVDHPVAMRRPPAPSELSWSALDDLQLQRFLAADQRDQPPLNEA